jgi:hypothetical protein
MALVYNHGEPDNKQEIIHEPHRVWTDIYSVIGLEKILPKETV